ncbi:hypothetical protein GCM10008018_65170 [Paenibacillus marchantiophytorum]|uniref:Glycosyl hydrolase n=1 Tax=Paenibacillus marchantiophytorum TaxID=1619310 RepID=A0ABQ1FFW2_9BACL|nr:hypothetical protein [Paenibacillus marchantiophytorum]GGA10872.1 hypothetical protein GCM10008018_65170 [Paenibacillus marchantiophytorum]
MIKRRYLLCSSVVLFLLLTACQADGSTAKRLDAKNVKHSYGEQLQVTQNRDILYQFITKKLTGSYGVYTNLLETDQTSEAATGHEVLSESAGLLMRYYALTGQKERFDEQWQLVKQTFDLSTGFSYRYSPKLQKKFTLNASVDDLRIIRALAEASLMFHTDGYKAELEAYGKRFYQNNIANDQLYDFYDETYKMRNTFITLCYIDTLSLKLLEVPKANKSNLESNMLKIAKEGYLSDEFPFYQTRYDYKTRAYQSENINTVESLLTILNLAEVGQQKDASIQFVKEQVKAGTLVGQYSVEGKPLNDVRSTAIYAMAAILGSIIGDKELYETSIQRMNEFQILDQQSPIYGGFGDTQVQQAYSFDNLMALLALAN